MKRAFDVVASLAGLVVLLPLLLLVALLIKLTSPGPVFFRQVRAGRGGRPFRIIKFRTMTADAPSRGPTITVEGDPRITPVGRVLRRTKVDELPQLLNVLAGEMSLVGPRPEVPHIVDRFPEDYRELLTVRPGITDPASLRFASEEQILSSVGDWERHYQEEVLPEKIRLSREYLRSATFLSDLRIILATVFRQ
jgi:lipopolysaccharide/colanic/teichoic acid biosynthesis glycosyltransferase